MPSRSKYTVAELQVAFFVNSGSEANDLAMKMARLYSGNYDFLALRNGYHGKRGLNAHSTWRYNMPQVPAASSWLVAGRKESSSLLIGIRHVVNCAQWCVQGFGVHYMMNPDPYRGPFGNDGAAYAAQVIASGPPQWPALTATFDPYWRTLAAPGVGDSVVALNTILTAAHPTQVKDTIQFATPGKVAGFIHETIQGVGGSVQLADGFLSEAYQVLGLGFPPPLWWKGRVLWHTAVLTILQREEHPRAACSTPLR